MKIVVLMSQMIGRNVASGGDRLSVEVAKKWALTHEITVIHPEATGPALMKEFELRSCKRGVQLCPFVERTYLHFFFVPMLYLVRAIQTWWALRRHEGHALVLSGDFICNTIPAFLCRRKFKVVAANVYHLNPSPFRRKNPFFASLASFAMQRASLWILRHCANRVMLLNRETRDGLIKKGFRPDALTIVGGGIDLGAISKSVPSAQKYDMVFAGRINPTKGVMDLVDVYRRVREMRPDCPLRLAIIGEDTTDYAEGVRRAFEKTLRRNDVHFLGFLPYDELYGILKSASVFVSPSYEEGWGMAVSEALACGTPVVAYDLPIYRESVPFNRFPFFTVPIGDKYAFARRVVRALRSVEQRRKESYNTKYFTSYDVLAQKHLAILREADK